MAYRGGLQRHPVFCAIAALAFLCISQIGQARSTSDAPEGGTEVMRYWTDKGTIWVSCTHSSCVNGSTVSMRPLPPRTVPSRADFHAEQIQLVSQGVTNSNGVSRAVGFTAPSVQRSRQATTMILRGHYERPGEPPTFITRGMIYCSDCTVSVVSSSTSQKRADAMFRYGYAHCKKR